MSNLALDPTTPLTENSLPTSAAEASTPWLTQVWQQSVAKPAARFGFFWIALVGLCAVFAPFIANSFPLLVKMDGYWSSPLARHLTAADVTLPITAIVFVWLYFVSRWSLSRKILIVACTAALVGGFSLLLLHPPQANVFEEYRNYQRDGKLQFVLHPLIPYSYGDHLSDQFSLDHFHPWAPGQGHWMGTDKFGADIASHMVYASRVAMAVGFISTGISIVIGVIVGGLMGYFVGWVDLLGMRVIEIFGAIPTIYLLLTVVAFYPEYRNIYLIMAIIGLTGWVEDARFVRAEFLKLRHQDFVQAATAAGLPLRSVLFRHLLPNAIAPLLVSASFGIAGAILTESSLSFLGLGIPVGDASWGALLNEAVGDGGSFHWWLATYPGIAIFLTVLSYNFIGEAVRDALDPKLRERN